MKFLTDSSPSFFKQSLNKSLLGMLIALLFVVNMTILFWEVSFFDNSIKIRAQERMAEVANGIEYAAEILTESNVPRLKRMILNYAANPDIDSITIFDHRGQVLAGSDVSLRDKHFTEITPENVVQMISEIYSSDTNKHHLPINGDISDLSEAQSLLRVIQSPIVGPAGTKGVLYVSFRLDRYSLEQRAFVNYSTVFIVLQLILIGFLVYYILYKQLSLPINALLDACSESVRSGHFDIPKIMPDNEIGRLAQTYSWTMDKLQEHRAELDSANNKMEAIFRSVQESILTIDKKGTVLSANSATLSMFGYHPEEIIGNTISMLLPDYHLEGSQNVLEILQGTNAKETFGKPQKLEGKKRSSQIFPIMLKITSGEANGESFYTVVIQDLTELVNIEQKLAENQALFQAAISSSVLGFALQDSQGHFIEVNPSLPRRVGYKKEDFMKLKLVDTLAASEQESMRKEWDQLLKGEIKEIRSGRLFQHKSGKQIWGLISASLVRSSYSGEDFVVTQVVDINNEKKLTMQLEQRNLELQRSNEDLYNFAYSASHDLKSPLNAIGNIVGWIEDDCGDILPEASKKHFEILKSRCGRMKKLLDDLLEYSRIGKLDFSVQAIQLDKLVRELFEIQDKSNGFSLTVDPFNVTLPKVPLEIVLRNLISNAIRHHDRDEGNISVTCEEVNECYLIKVIDDGPGIPPELQDKAMEMFQTLRSRDEVEGSGMGLAMINKILEHFSGRLEIHSDGQNGTELHVIWPKIRISQEEQTANTDGVTSK